MHAQRERIVRATIECIAQRGAERTSITDICREAGLSAGALYTHFKNKEAIIADALLYGSPFEIELPLDWVACKAILLDVRDQMGFSASVIVRARLHLHAGCVSPGPLRDLYQPFLRETLTRLADHLQRMADAGSVKLKMSPERTAVSITAFIDGMLWIALASGQPLEELKPELSLGLDCFVD